MGSLSLTNFNAGGTAPAIRNVNERAVSVNPLSVAKSGLEISSRNLHVHAARSAINIGDIVNDVKDGVNDAVDDVKDGVDDAVDDVKDGVDDAVDDVKDGVDDTIDDVKDGVDDTIDDVKDGVDDTIDKVGDGVDDAVDDVKDGVDDTIDKVGDWIDDAGSAFKSTVDKLIDEIKDIAEDIKDEIKDISEEIPTSLEDFFRKLGKEIQGKINDLGPKIDEIAEDSVDSVRAALKPIVEFLKPVVDLIIKHPSFLRLMVPGTELFILILGFTSGGVAKGSIAARIESIIGNPRKGSIFAFLQSAGAGGYASQALARTNVFVGVAIILIMLTEYLIESGVIDVDVKATIDAGWDRIMNELGPTWGSESESAGVPSMDFRVAKWAKYLAFTWVTMQVAVCAHGDGVGFF